METEETKKIIRFLRECYVTEERQNHTKKKFGYVSLYIQTKFSVIDE